MEIRRLWIRNRLRNRAGMSLIELMLAISILGIVGLAMATMFSSQSKEMRGLTEKIGSLNLKNSIILNLGVRQLCTRPEGVEPLIFDSTLPPEESEVKIPRLYISKNENAPILIEAGKRVEGETPTLEIAPSGILLKDITEIATGQYSAKLIVQLNDQLLLRTLRAFEFEVLFAGTGPAVARQIEDCFSGKAPDTKVTKMEVYDIGRSGEEFSVPAGVTEIIVEAWGGGGGGAGACNYGAGGVMRAAGGGGGGSGSYGRFVVPVSPGTKFKVTVGPGGAAGHTHAGLGDLQTAGGQGGTSRLTRVSDGQEILRAPGGGGGRKPLCAGGFKASWGGDGGGLATALPGIVVVAAIGDFGVQGILNYSEIYALPGAGGGGLSGKGGGGGAIYATAVEPSAGESGRVIISWQQ